MRRAAVVFAGVVALGLGGAIPADAHDRGRWFVQAGAAAPGAGTRAAPFASLAAVRAASRRGDRIVVLPSAGVLDGGLRLRPRQRLVGAGPSVRSLAVGVAAPRLTNTSASGLSGDAVRLARGAVVRNVAISGAVRGAIYGLDTPRVRVLGNDITAFNTSCATGFLIPPFNVPTLIPGGGIPISGGLQNAFAGIMLDASSGRGPVVVRRNHVHDSDCGDGIDIRLSGSARRRAVVAGNTVTGLREGPGMASLLAIGLQTRDASRLVARLDRNVEGGLGNDEDLGVGPAGADSEGVFLNPVGGSTLRAVVTRDTYTHVLGRSGFSANGLEFVSMGEGSHGDVVVRDSTFSGTPGDVIEQLALGTNGHLALTLDNVVAKDSTGFAGVGNGNTVVIPANNGDCVVGASGGAGNAVELDIRHSTLANCANNGLIVGSAVANGSGPTSSLRLGLSDSTLIGNRGHNLRIGNLTGLGSLRVKVERSNLSDALGTENELADASFENLGSTDSAIIDLGGGGLGSVGGNCLSGGPFAMNLIGYAVSAEHNWWGTPGGPALGRVTNVGGTLDAGAALDAAPAGC